MASDSYQVISYLLAKQPFTKIWISSYNFVEGIFSSWRENVTTTRYGHFEYTVMSFGLTSARVVFHHMTNDIFRDFLDIFTIIYLDDINLLKDTRGARPMFDELYNDYGYMVLCQTREVLCWPQPCGICGIYVVSPESISMDPKKVQIVLDWKTPC